jgi:hypothetical protein
MTRRLPTKLRPLLLGCVLSVGLASIACGPQSTGDGSGGGSQNNADDSSAACEEPSDCETLSCVCNDGTNYSAFATCNVVNGEGTCGTCSDACSENGGAFENPEGCLDPTDGTTSDFRGSDDIGAACDKDAFQSSCTSGRCIDDGSGQGFCTDTCTSDDDCNGLKCAAYTAEGNTFRYCLAANSSWCGRP